jgi:hypothetical protein
MDSSLLGLDSLPERFMGKQSVVCHLPGPHPEKWTAVSLCLLACRQDDVTPRIGPRKREPLHVSRASVPRRDPHESPLLTISYPCQNVICHLREALCSPSLSGPKTSTPSTFRGRLMSARRPHSRFLPRTITISRQFLL